MNTVRLRLSPRKLWVFWFALALLLPLIASALQQPRVARAAGNVVISGILDGTFTGGEPKTIELYIDGTVDLSGYQVQRAANGGSFNTSISLSGTYTDAFVYLVGSGDVPEFESIFGADGDFANIVVESGNISGNGNDAFRVVELTSTSVVDQVAPVSSTNSYQDSYMYRNDGTGPDGGWVPGNWSIPGNNVLDGLSAAEIAALVPFGTYSPGGGGGTPLCAATHTIAEVQGSGSDSPLAGAIVTVQGIVTAAFGDQFFMQNGPGPRSGLLVFAPDHTASRGDEVCVTGEVAEFFGMTEITEDPTIEILSAGNALPAAEVLPATAINTGSPTAEDWEGVLVQVQNVTVTDADLGFGEFLVTDTSGSVRVDDKGSWSYVPSAGDSFDAIIGVLDYTFSDFKLQPRDDDDLAGLNVPPPSGACPAPPAIAFIHEVQGTTDVSPCVNETVTIEGVVVGNYEADATTAASLRGFYVQEEDSDQDGDPATSEGIFVFTGNAASVADLGDLVQVTGTVSEFQGQTQLSGSDLSVVQVATDVSLTPTGVTMPFPEPVDGVPYQERFEGMLVQFPQVLYVTEHFQLGRFGQVVMSSGDRLFQPTSIAQPGSAALAQQAANDLNKIIVDDELQNQNPDPIRFGRGGDPLSASNTLRGGDTVTDLVGVMTYTWAGNRASGNAYRVRPINDLSDTGLVPGGVVPDFQPANPRPTAAPDVGGSLTVVSFNVLNYFLTLDDGTAQCGPLGNKQGCRGADSELEFTRQREKLLAALLKLDADVVGLVELENTQTSAGEDVNPARDIVDGLNTRLGSEVYRYIDTGIIGTDTIRVGIIYKPAMVQPVGDFAVIDETVDPRFDTSRNRPSLAQTFAEVDSDEVFTVVVNHFKSKSGSELDDPGGICVDGDPSNDIPDCDQGDGQGYFNAARTAAAEALADWLATDPTGSGDPDSLIIGDLNAYAMEDPVRVLEQAGYTNLVKLYGGERAYSYVFDGQWGYLDYGLASPTLLPQVTGTAEYHINADEPNVLDYNTNFKSESQIESLFNPDEFRVSDHDPVLVGLNLNQPKIDVYLRLNDLDVSYDPFDSRAAAGVFTIRSTFRNASQMTFQAPFFKITQLSGGNVVLNTDTGSGGAGSTVFVPAAQLGGNAALDPDESFTVEFQVGLAEPRAFDFFVSAFGVPGDGAAPASPISLSGAEGFRFSIGADDLQPRSSHAVYVPVVSN